MTDFEVLATRSAASPAVETFKFERDDWSLFRTVEGLQQKAGVPKDKLPRLVLKELADNGLDAGAKVRIGELSTNKWFVEDTGPGIDGTPEDIARLFSIARPMVSTKLLRLPTRGALGNGLRVVAGAVLASEGTLTVTTRNRRIELRPERDGTTKVLGVEKVDFPVGTRVEIGFGRTLPCNGDTACWAKLACTLAPFGETYTGRTSPWWYDPPQFHELLYAAGTRPVRDLISTFDGCSGAKAGEIVTAAGLGRTACKNVSRSQATELLRITRTNARPVNPKRLGAVGPLDQDVTYACTPGTVRVGAVAPHAEIPFVVEAWAAKATVEKSNLTVFVNRTPVTGDIHASRDKRDIDAFGCGLAHTIAKAPRDLAVNIWINITTPFMPITSDGKAPDLRLFLSEIRDAVGKVVRKVCRTDAGNGTQKGVVLDNLDDAIANVGGDGEFMFNQRQLLYVLRPIVKKETGEKLTTAHFGAIITDYENEHGEIPLMYREPRGSISHPHRNETITLGTLMVENYKRPVWLYNKLLYIEKEGANEALKAVRWAERHDCMVMSSKGFSTRAARDLIDKLAEHDEPIDVFCAHDADAYGTMIYQTLQDETKARGARKIRIINLGLEAWEAIGMGLEIEETDPPDRRRPVADYVRRRSDRDWEEWYQTRRIELNAMTTPQFIAWLDAKMSPYSKLIPPPAVLEAELNEYIEAKLRANITERILREADFEAQVAAALTAIKRPDTATLAKGIAQLFQRKPDREWRDHIEAEAKLLLRGKRKGSR